MLIGLLLVGGGVAMLRDGGPVGEQMREGQDGLAGSSVEPGTGATDGGPGPSTVPAGSFCTDAGYLCADLAGASSVTLRRWVRHEGTVVVHVPLPSGEEPTTARALQRAAASGVRAWNNQPFPILVDLRGDRSPHFAVEWSSGLGGSQLGLARTSWSQGEGLRVVAVSLGTRQPFDRSRVLDAQQVRLTAAHEMGHALGLPHSDEPRDVMYPTNTATSMSARDYRSIEVLYATPNGTVIKR